MWVRGIARSMGERVLIRSVRSRTKVVVLVAVVGLAALVVAATSLGAEEAGLHITGVTLVGPPAGQTAAAPAARVDYQVSGTVTDSSGNNNAWNYTAYQIDGGSWTCVNTTNVDSGSATVTVPGSGEITLPGAGAHTVSFRMYTDAGCASGEFSATHTINPAIAPRTSNPNLAGSCGQMNVVLILDESSSITNNAAYVTNVKDAAKAFVNGLKGTGTNLAVVEFDETATKPLGAAYVPISDPVPAAWTNYIDNQYGSNNFWSKGAYTNWQDALVKTTEFDAVKNADLVVFITDGDPTAYGVSPAAITTGEPDGYNTGLKPAFDIANGLKAGGSHLFMVGVGAAVGADADAPNKKLRMKGISDDEELLADASNIKTADVTFVTDFAKLQAQLALIATELCRSQVTVLKQVDDGQGYLPVSGSKPGWDFTAGVTVNTGTFAFDPGAGPGPLTTTATGATFQWKPNSLVATSDVTITESGAAELRDEERQLHQRDHSDAEPRSRFLLHRQPPLQGQHNLHRPKPAEHGNDPAEEGVHRWSCEPACQPLHQAGRHTIAGGFADNVASGGGTAVLTVPTGNVRHLGDSGHGRDTPTDFAFYAKTWDCTKNGAAFIPNTVGSTGSVAVGTGEDIVCTFHNAFVDPKLSVTKVATESQLLEGRGVIHYTIVATNTAT